MMSLSLLMPIIRASLGVLRHTWPYIAVLALLVAGYLYAYNAGVRATTAKYEAIQTQMVLDSIIAVENATKFLRERLAKQEEENLKLVEELSKNDEEAVKDPNASRPALGSDSVRRLNKIR